MIKNHLFNYLNHWQMGQESNKEEGLISLPNLAFHPLRYSIFYFFFWIIILARHFTCPNLSNTDRLSNQVSERKPTNQYFYFLPRNLYKFLNHLVLITMTNMIKLKNWMKDIVFWLLKVFYTSNAICRHPIQYFAISLSKVLSFDLMSLIATGH